MSDTVRGREPALQRTVFALPKCLLYRSWHVYITSNSYRIDLSEKYNGWVWKEHRFMAPMVVQGGSPQGSSAASDMPWSFSGSVPQMNSTPMQLQANSSKIPRNWSSTSAVGGVPMLSCTEQPACLSKIAAPRSPTPFHGAASPTVRPW